MKSITSALLFLLSQAVFSQLEIPTPDDSCYIVEHEYYTLCYNEKHEQASWVAYAISYDMLKGTAKRREKFREDPKVQSGSAQKTDFRRSGYDRGHLAPAAVMKASKLCMSESFYLSNMSPQVPGFNRGIWKELEAWVRRRAMFVSQYDTVLYVVTGPILTNDLKTIGPNKVSVPEYYFKVIYDPIGPQVGAGLAFLMKNEPSSLEPTDNTFRVSIDSIEALTGIDFFPLLEDKRETEIESNNTLLIYPVGGLNSMKVNPSESVIRCQATTNSGM